MIRLYSAGSLVEAQLLHDLLAQTGIDAYILNANAQGGLGEIPFANAYPEIWLADDADRLSASLLIEEFLAVRADSAPVFCRSCGEENPAHFRSCWHCRNAL